MKNRVIAFILALTSLFMCTVSVFADDNVETFISEVALVYEDSVEEARAAIAGTDWKLYEKDLNPKADLLFDNGAYLVYKTTTNVDEAITDLRVMDMYGGYNSSNYEKQLEDSRKEYESKIVYLNAIISDFKLLYEQDNEIAKLAYRQMNYYKDTKVSATSEETDLLMGDFFLSQPKQEDLVRVLMEGNAAIVSSLLSLLALGVSGSSDSSLVTRVKEQYKNADKIDSSLYNEAAIYLGEMLRELQPKILAFDALKDKYDIESEEISEEQYYFYNEIVPIVTALSEIMLGDVSLCDLVRDGTYDNKDLYPVVAAFTPSQQNLVYSGLFELVLKYANPKTPDAEFYTTIENLEMELKDENGNIIPTDIYVGVDRSIFEGSFAMTNAAERYQAMTGETWDVGKSATAMSAFHIASLCLLAVDALFSVTFFGINRIGYMISKLAVAKTISIETVFNSKILSMFVNAGHAIQPWISVAGWTALGIALAAAGLVGIGTIYNYYNPNYTVIPDTMIDIREGDVGDHYVKYTAAKVYGDKDGRNADFNAYEGKEWIALYYTKDATAGNCLTPNFVYSNDSNTIARRHQGVSMFGETRAFNLNSHVYGKDAPAVYLSVRYSSTEKSEENIPNIIGAMIATGSSYMLTAAGGATMGILVMMQMQKRKKSVGKTAPPADDNKVE